MAKHGLPVYPIYDEMIIQADQSPEEIVWLLEHGLIERSLLPGRTEILGWDTKNNCPIDIAKVTPDIPKSLAGRPLCHQTVTRHDGKYVFIVYDDEYRGDDPQPEHYILRQYDTLDSLIVAEHISFTERGIESIWWRWLDWKPDLFDFIKLANGEVVAIV